MKSKNIQIQENLKKNSTEKVEDLKGDDVEIEQESNFLNHLHPKQQKIHASHEKCDPKTCSHVDVVKKGEEITGSKESHSVIKTIISCILPLSIFLFAFFFIFFPLCVAYIVCKTNLYDSVVGNFSGSKRLSTPADKKQISQKLSKNLERYLDQNFLPYADFLKNVTVEELEIPHISTKQNFFGEPFVLRGWFLKTPNTNQIAAQNPNLRTAILVHSAFCDRREMVKHARYFAKIGINSLLFDSSDHGASDYLRSHRGAYLGVKEVNDLKSVMNFVKQDSEKYGSQFIVLGSSQGASVSLMGSVLESKNELIVAPAQGQDKQKTICMVIAENPFSNRKQQIFESIAQTLRVGGWGTAQRGKLYRLFARFDFIIPNEYIRFLAAYTDFIFGGLKFTWELDEELEKLRGSPLFLIHSKTDILVYVSHSHKIYNFLTKNSTNDGSVEFWEMESGRHTKLYEEAPQQYEERVLNFVKKHADCH